MVGEQIGRYRLDAEIGRGGMGVVYKATQVTLDRTVAVKMLPRQMADEENLERFRREARTLAKLDHQGIVHIYDVEEHEGSHFIIMEHVGGGSLGDLISREAPLAVDRAVEITAQVASGLSAAHRRGIIHRDIKPDNILFDEAGRAKLTDFGIAHMRDANSKTKTGVMLGTPYYMSPEQARGRPVTPASDLYALGVLMFEMLSGRVPFTGEDAVAIAIKHIQEAAPPLAEVAPDAPPSVTAIVDRLMAKEPEQRYASADAVIEALRDAGWGIGRDTLGGTGAREAPDLDAFEAGGPASPGDAEAATTGGRIATGARALAARTGSTHLGGTLNAPSFAGFPRSFWIGAVMLALVAVLLVPRLGRGGSAEPVRSQTDGPGGAGPATPAVQGTTPGPQAPSVTVTPEDAARIAGLLNPGTGQGRQPAGPPPDQPEPSQPEGPVTPGRANAPEEDETERVTPTRGFDASAARRAIGAMIERQRRATEAGDLEAMLRDVHPDILAIARNAGAQLFAAASDIQSEVSGIEIEFEDSTVAGVAFYARQTGVLRANGQRVLLAEGYTQWIVVFESGRWLIAGF